MASAALSIDFLSWARAGCTFAALSFGGYTLLSSASAAARDSDVAVNLAAEAGSTRGLVLRECVSALENEKKLSVCWAYFFLASYVSLRFGGVDFPPTYEQRLYACCVFLAVWRVVSVVGEVGASVLDELLGRLAPPSPSAQPADRPRLRKRASVIAADAAVRRAHAVLSITFKVSLHFVGFLVSCENVGIHMTGFVSSMGFLGIAISLGAQYVLQDLLGYMALMLDSSVVVGDCVIVGGGPKGHIEAIGYMTTKVRTLDGELLIYTNRDFAVTRVMNCSRQPHRLVTIYFDVAGNTRADKLETVRSCAEQAVNDIAAGTHRSYDQKRDVSWAEFKMKFHCVFMANLGGGGLSGIGFEIYYYLDGNATKPLEFETKSLVLVRLAKLLEEEGVELQCAHVGAALSSGAALGHLGGAGARKSS
eukprot:TRINITY_DN23829_c0_g2_i1.p1 TRINITY_DN23829_c0_g2~~TRINITY_DN23829_c0_g2_i1.p1  ORF type:complete len:421 (-),score=98.43 TRINITY_DN23829_c0_g2_i1:5-1267(-)